MKWLMRFRLTYLELTFDHSNCRLGHFNSISPNILAILVIVMVMDVMINIQLEIWSEKTACVASQIHDVVTKYDIINQWHKICLYISFVNNFDQDGLYIVLKLTWKRNIHLKSPQKMLEEMTSYSDLFVKMTVYKVNTLCLKCTKSHVGFSKMSGGGSSGFPFMVGKLHPGLRGWTPLQKCMRTMTYSIY